MTEFKGITRPGRYRIRNGEIAVVEEKSGLGTHLAWEGKIGPSGLFGGWSDFGRWGQEENDLDIIAGPLDDEPQEMAGLTDVLRRLDAIEERLSHVPQALVKPETKRETCWMNVYLRPSQSEIQSGVFYNTKAQADARHDKTRIACLEISFTHGEGLD